MELTTKNLIALWPRCFSEHRQPIGKVREQIIAALDGVASKTAVKNAVCLAISDYVNDVEYLARIKAGRERIGLDGEPAGIITVEEEERARAKLASKLHPANADKPRLTLCKAVQS